MAILRPTDANYFGRVPAETVSFVNTGSSAGGDGTTNATAGANRAYPSLANWDSNEARDITGEAAGHIVYCSGTAADSEFTLSSSWVTDEQHPLMICASDIPSYKTNGSASGYNYTDYLSTSHYRVVRADDLGDVITINGIGAGGFLIIDGVTIQFSAVNTNDGITGSDIGSGATVRLQNCRLKGLGGGQGINLSNSATALEIQIYNSIIDDWATGADPETANTSMALVNCVITNCGTAALVRTAGVLEAFNTISFNNADDWPATMDQIYACASDDGNSADPLHVDMSPGGTEADDWNDRLENYAEGNYRMIPSLSNPLFLAGTRELLSESSMTLLTEFRMRHRMGKAPVRIPARQLRLGDIKGNSIHPHIPSIGAYEFKEYMAAGFDGVGNRMVLDASLGTDDDIILIAMDFDLGQAGDGQEITIFESTSGRMSLKRTAGDAIQFTAVDETSGSTIVDISSDIDIVAADGRVTLLIGVRTTSGSLNAEMYINDMDVKVETTLSAGTMDLTEAKFVLGANVSESENAPMGLRFFCLARGTYSDFGTEANRRVFFNADNVLSLSGIGQNGSNIPGTVDIFYLFDNPEDHPDDIVEPSGNNFTVNGILHNRTWPPDVEWTPFVNANGDWIEFETDRPWVNFKTVV